MKNAAYLLGALPLAVAICTSTLSLPAQSQATDAPVTRMQIKMERDEFLKTHRWDEYGETWMLKSGVEPPANVKSRAEVKAARDAFLRNNKWDPTAGGWLPLKATPRDLNGMTREQVKSETEQFLKTHYWDEDSEGWLEKSARSRKP
ncbi:MAG: hypothetical protein H7143_04470 [Pseudorhodobacter sp.]|nr:hypothetical protein [Rhizobacter sp.]